MAKDKFCKSPMDMIASPSKGNRGGPGKYDGEPGYKERTKSKDQVPEKTYDGSVKGGGESAPGYSNKK